MSEKEFEEYLLNHPELIFDTKTGVVKRRSKNQCSEEKANATTESAKPQKPRKYRNIKVYEYEDGFVAGKKKIDGHGPLVATFDSIKEYQRWCELTVLKKAGTISNLERQKKLLIEEGGVYRGERILPITYNADFVYEENGEIVVEDVKGIDQRTGKIKVTKDFVLKWKLLKKRYPRYVFRIF